MELRSLQVLTITAVVGLVYAMRMPETNDSFMIIILVVCHILFIAYYLFKCIREYICVKNSTYPSDVVNLPLVKKCKI